MLTEKIAGIFLALVIVCSSSSFLNAVVKVEDASVEGARAVLVELVGFSKKQALRTAPAQKLLSGEMLRLETATFGELTDAPDKVFLIEKNRAVGRLQQFGENNRITDVYFYLLYDRGWKVTAVRSMSLTGIIEQVYSGLKAKPNLTAEERDLYENFKFTLAPDKELKTWFSRNRNSLDRLRAALRSRRKDAEVYVGRDDKKFFRAARLLRRLNLSSASVQTNGDLEIIIGGITDNTVGFIYSPSKKPPEINPSLYIWVEEVAANWYLFRTT